MAGIDPRDKPEDFGPAVTRRVDRDRSKFRSVGIIRRTNDVDGRHKGGRDDMEWPIRNAASIAWTYLRTAVIRMRT
jgi:hypothetical protein